jgi:S-adenosylmethionine hydrolase
MQMYLPHCRLVVKGINITKFGDHISDYTICRCRSFDAGQQRHRGEVYIDRFGNLITNIESKIDDFCRNNPCENLKGC